MEFISELFVKVEETKRRKTIKHLSAELSNNYDTNLHLEVFLVVQSSASALGFNEAASSFKGSVLLSQ